MYKKDKLDNGLRVVTHSMPGMRSLALGIWIRVGGRYEVPEIKGAAHFIEHLLFKGSKKYSCRAIKESIEGLGGSLNGFTSEELTCYFVKIPALYLDSAVSILSDMVISPLFLKPDIEKERTVILEEIKMYKDLPQSYVHELLDQLLWPGQPLGQSILGTTDSISRIKRSDLVSFKENYYSAANIVVSAAGSLEHDKLVKKIAGNFSGLPLTKKNIFIAARQKQNCPQVKILAKETEQTHLALGFHSFKRDDPLRHAVGLLNIILGGNMSSRLFNQLREKRGLAYEIGTQLKRFYDTGAFVVHAGIDNQKLDQAIELILKELSLACNKLVSASEFRRAKDFYLGQLMLALEDTLDNMFWIGDSTAVLDKTYTFKQLLGEVKKVRREDLQEAAKAMFKNENLNLSLIGPLKESADDVCRKLKIN